MIAAFGVIARRRRKRDERQRPTQRAVMPAGDGAWHSPRPRRRLALRGRLAFGFLDELLGTEPQRYSLIESTEVFVARQRLQEAE